MTRKRLVLWAGLSVFALFAGCGRSPATSETTDIGIQNDVGVPDAWPYDALPPDAMAGDFTITDSYTGDGPAPCVPNCTNICELERVCGIIQPSEVKNCETKCQQNPATPELQCLAQLACLSTPACAQANQCLLKPLVPDLVVSHTASSPGAGVLVLQAKVCNQGNGSAGAFSVHFYRNQSTPPAAGQKGDHVYPVAGLAPGVCQTVSASATGLSTGVYNTWAQADTEGAVVESDETNNLSGPQSVSVTGTPTNKPDLVVANMTPMVDASAGTVTYTISVCNNGQAASTATSLEIYVNSLATPTVSQAGDLYVAVSALAANSCTAVKQIAKLTSTGATYVSWAWVDRKDTVAESVETNNLYGPVKFSVGGTPQPDLVVTAMAVASGSTGLVYFKVSVCNQGNAAAVGASTLALYADSASAPGPSIQPDKELALPSSIAAGSCTSLAWQTTGKPGSYKAWAVADVKNAIAESNESNNTYGPVAYTVTGGSILADLVVTSLTGTVSSTGVVTYSGTVCNTGLSATTAASVAGLYVNLSTAPTTSLKPDLVATVASGLAAGACAKVLWSIALKAGTYSSWALADSSGVITESSETNNSYGPVTITVSGTTQLPDLYISKFSATVSSSGAVTYSGTVCNKGAGATAASSIAGVYVNRTSLPTTADKPDLVVTIPSGMAAMTCTAVTWTTSLKPGTYASYAMADTGGNVIETSEVNNAWGPLSVTVASATPLPDLYISSATATLSSSGYVYYQVSICNKGTAAVNGANLDLYYNRTSAPTANDPGNQTTTLTNIAVGACTSRNMAVVLSPGSYSSWFYVDRTNVVAENDETNNTYGPVKVTVPGTGKPDLYVVNASVSQSSGGMATYYITICNKGTATAGTSDLDLYYNSATVPPATLPGNNSTYLQSLTAGACTTRTLYATLPGGTYSSWVRLDRTDVVSELDETNNTYGPIKLTVTGTGSPDLVITSVTTSPYYTYERYYVTVCNKGTATAGYARLDLYYNRTTQPGVNDVGERYTNTSTLAAGACNTSTIYATLSPGTYSSWLWIDRTNAVLESVETNNIYGPVKVTVSAASQPDLQVTSFTATSTGSSSVTYLATVCNQGQGTAGYAFLDIYYNSASAPSTNQQGNTTAYVQPLAAGACTSITRNANLSSGTYSSWARVDRTDQVTESDETNNLKGPLSVTVGATSTYCQDICKVLVSPCNLLPSSQYTTCVTMCSSLSATKISCAYTAAQAGNCSAITQCMLGP